MTTVAEPERFCPGCHQLAERRAAIDERGRAGKPIAYALVTLARARREHRTECITPTETKD